jgi:transcriptional regulator of acetoin/glycerol metabolism
MLGISPSICCTVSEHIRSSLNPEEMPMGLGKWHTADAPRQLFSTTAAERVAIARRQFFEEGMRPSGLVSEAVIQSWMRCHRLHPDPQRQVAFAPVTPSRLHATRERCRSLLQVAQHEISAMERALAGADVRVLLTDGDGVALYLSPVPESSAPHLLSRHMGEPGSNIGERIAGTTAPGIVAATGQACTVSGAEHYFDDLRLLQCAAAPIRNVHGKVVGVLDLTTLARPFGFDAGQMVGMHATVIENALLQAQSQEHLVLRFQLNPALLETPLQGLAGITTDGTVAWLNDAGSRMVGPLPADRALRGVERLFGHGLSHLLRLSTHATPRFLRLASGLGVWMQARLQTSGTALPPHAEAAAATSPAAEAPGLAEAPCGTADMLPRTSLREHSRQLVETTLAAHGGNISQAARQLRISRGTLYRLLRNWEQTGR